MSTSSHAPPASPLRGQSLIDRLRGEWRLYAVSRVAMRQRGWRCIILALVVAVGTLLVVRYENHRRWRAFQQVLARCGPDEVCKKAVRDEADRAGMPHFVEPDLGLLVAWLLATAGLVLLEVHRSLASAVPTQDEIRAVEPAVSSAPAKVVGVSGATVLFIVSRDRPDLYSSLDRACARVRDIHVVSDSRVRDRRRVSRTLPFDRRQGDRRIRASVDAEIREYGSAIVMVERHGE